MLEVKIMIEAPELVNAINNLATAVSGVKTNCITENTSEPVSPSAPLTTSVPASAPPVQPVIPTNTANIPAPNVPLAQAPKYTVEQIMSAGAMLMDAGKVNELMNLLHSFGVQAVVDLKPEQLGAFATALRELGAKI